MSPLMFADGEFGPVGPRSARPAWEVCGFGAVLCIGDMLWLVADIDGEALLCAARFPPFWPRNGISA